MKRILNSLVICLLIAPVSFSQDIKLSGQVSVENNQIKNVGDPTDPQDAVTLSYLGLAPTYNELTILDDLAILFLCSSGSFSNSFAKSRSYFFKVFRVL